MAYAPDRMTLVADIGGTNTRVALAEAGQVRHETIRKYANAEHPDLESVLRKFLAEAGGVDCAGACVAAAGPVRDGVAEMTNLDWTIDGQSVAAATRAETVAVLNDLQAQGHALGHLAASALRHVTGPRHGPAGASQLVIGVGTGFNAAPVHEGPGGRIVAASECGHVTLPVRTAEELRLAEFVEKAHGFPGVEDALSGRGLERVHAWAAAEAGRPAERPAAEIMAAIGAGGDAVAEHAGRVFVTLLGAVAGNLALTHLPFGGTYLIGGVARAFTPHFDRLGFVQGFRDKGRFSAFMEQFPVYVIEDDFAALQGCASYLQAVRRGAA